MKIFFICILQLLLSLIAHSQNSLILSDNDLLQKSDLKKKAGWIKVEINSEFKEAENAESAVYEYYDFCNVKGEYSLFYSKKLKFPVNCSKISYTKADPNSTSKILNGTVDFYDKNRHRAEKYIFKDGFAVKIYEFDWWGMFRKKYYGKLFGVLEYSHEKNKVESWGNYFAADGTIYSDSHEIFDETKINSLPIRPTPISREDLYIGNVWQEAEFNSYQYEMFIDSSAHEGKKAASIKSIDKKIEGSGMLKQICRADKYLGKRIKLSGFIKTDNVADWAALRLRVDQAGSNQLVAYGYFNKGINGTTPWTKYDIVLDVPENASTITFGAQLKGTGQIWFDDFTFEIADKSVNTTGWSINSNPSGITSEPVNLDFEK